MTTVFDKQYFGRPCLLMTVWSLALAAFLFLIFGMMIDELTRSSFSIVGVEYKVVCSSHTFDTIPGTPNRNYIEAGFTETILQKQAGDAWLAMGILACLALPTLLYGIFTDYFAGQWDYKKCPCSAFNIGFTSLSIYIMMAFELLQIIAYSAASRCGKEAFYEQVFLSVNDLRAIGGASFAMIILSFICLLSIIILTCYYQYGISAELPTGEKKDAPVQFNKAAMGTPTEKEPKKEVKVAGPSGQAPESKLFKPTKNVTNTIGNGENRPSGPPPAPQPKPSSPVPMPPR